MSNHNSKSAGPICLKFDKRNSNLSRLTFYRKLCLQAKLGYQPSIEIFLLTWRKRSGMAVSRYKLRYQLNTYHVPGIKSPWISPTAP